MKVELGERYVVSIHFLQGILKCDTYDNGNGTSLRNLEEANS